MQREKPDYDIKIIFAVLDDKFLAIGEETLKALAYAVRNVTVTKRNTLLKERLEIEK